MPAPTAAEIESKAKRALADAGIAGAGAGQLATALARITADALSQLISQAHVLPGTPVAVDPVTGSGSVTGPGQLAAPPVGGPDASMIAPLACSALEDSQITGAGAPALARVIAETLARSIELFTTQVQVEPGTPIASFATTAPGRLM